MDAQLLLQVTDVDGARFWHENFGGQRTVSFRRFMEAYRVYLFKVYMLKRMSDEHASTLLRYTIFPFDVVDTALHTSEVTIELYSNWLRRYGPLKDTLCKMVDFSSPDSVDSTSRTEEPVCPVWFGNGMGREAAERRLTEQFAAYQTSGIRPQHMIIVRYSSDPSIHFVVTAKPGPKFEHYAIVNSSMGYTMVGEEPHFCPTISDCIQYYLFDKLFSKIIGTGSNILFPRSCAEKWGAIITAAVSELPSSHYFSIEDLDRCIQEVRRSSSQPEESRADTFQSLFPQNDASLADATRAGQNEAPKEAAQHFHDDAESEVVVKSVPQDDCAAAVSERRQSAVPSCRPTVEVGIYMLDHALKILFETGHIDEHLADRIRNMVPGGRNG
jgi:hypothetical protein